MIPSERAPENIDEAAMFSRNVVDANHVLLGAKSLGPPAGQNLWVQEGARRRRSQAGRHSPRYVENEHRVPLEQAGRMISTLST